MKLAVLRLRNLLSAVALFTVADVARAGNGLNAYAFGAESLGMAGADLAVTQGPLSLAINPAGLGGFKGREASAYIEAYRGFFTHTDDVGNNEDVDNPYNAVFGGGYAQALSEDGAVAAGVALFGQGGVGFVYEDLQTQFGTEDELSALFGVFRIAPGVGWQINERISIGATLGFNYSSAEQKLFPDTSATSGDPFTPGFRGFSLDGADGFSWSGKLGLRYAPSPAWTFALVYTTRTPIKLEGGDLRVNYESDGKGRVKYRDAAVKGLALARELGAGAAWRPNGKWLLSAELNWLDWSSALGIATLEARDPDTGGVPSMLSLPFPLNYRDQYVISAGAEYAWSTATRVRAGYNYGRNPVPSENLSPIFNLIAEHLLCFGASHRFSTKWEMSASLALSPHVEEDYRNPSIGLGTQQQETWGLIDLGLSLSRRW